MCLYTKSGKFITQEPITCYKVLYNDSHHKNYVSPFRNFTYNLGVTYETELGVITSITKSIDLMSLIKFYFRLRKSKLYKMSLKDFIHSWIHEYKIEEGFHAYTNEIIAFHRCSAWGSAMVVTRCIIPKGSEVYFNEKEIVSNKIIVNSLV